MNGAALDSQLSTLDRPTRAFRFTWLYLEHAGMSAEARVPVAQTIAAWRSTAQSTAGRLLALGVFELLRGIKRILLTADHRPLRGEPCVECAEIRPLLGELVIGMDRGRRALGLTCSTIDNDGVHAVRRTPMDPTKGSLCGRCRQRLDETDDALDVLDGQVWLGRHERGLAHGDSTSTDEFEQVAFAQPGHVRRIG